MGYISYSGYNWQLNVQVSSRVSVSLPIVPVRYTFLGYINGIVEHMHLTVASSSVYCYEMPNYHCNCMYL